MKCGEGQQNQKRTCSNPSPRGYGEDCVGEREEVRPCNKEPCVSSVVESKHFGAGHVNLAFSLGLDVSVFVGDVLDSAESAISSGLRHIGAEIVVVFVLDPVVLNWILQFP